MCVLGRGGGVETGVFVGLDLPSAWGVGRELKQGSDPHIRAIV